jgi:hypothetical protein
MENPILQSNIVDFKPQAPISASGAELAPIAQAYGIAVVTQVKNHIPQSVALNGNNYPVTGYLSTMPGIAPGMSIGDKVLISAVEEGVLIHGVVMPPDAPMQASFAYVEGKLVIEAQGAVILKSGKAMVELTEAGEIFIDGKDVRTVADDVRTVAHESLTLLGGKVELN